MIKTGFAHIIWITLIMGLMAGLCGCEVVTNIFLGPDEGATDGKDISVLHAPILMDIGLVLPLTGEYADAYGIPMLRGFELARREISRSPVSPVRFEFISGNDMSTSDGMVNAFQRLVDEGVPAIVGIVISTHAEQAFPIAQENGVVAFSSASSAAGLSSIGDYIFRAALAVDRMNPAGVRITHSNLGYARVAMIYDDADVWSTSSNEHLTAALLELGVEITTTQTVQTGDTDYTAQLTAIAESQPDALFISGLAAEVTGIMMQAHELGIEVPYIAPEISVNEVRLAGEAAEGAITFSSWSSLSDNRLNQGFIERYKASFGMEPVPWAAQSYATLMILYAGIVTALSTGTEAPDAEAIRDALATVENMETNLGSFSFDANGEAVYEPVVLIVKDGTLQLFDALK